MSPTLMDCLTLALLLPAAGAATPVSPGMKSFGVAVKQAHLFKGVEKTVFEHNLSATATHGTPLHLILHRSHPWYTHTPPCGATLVSRP